MQRTKRFVLAVDVGQSNDYTAVIILRSSRTAEWIGAFPDDKRVHQRQHDLVHAERFRQIPYPDQIRRVRERFQLLKEHARLEHGDVPVSLVVDATGVGKPILDVFREAGMNPHGIVITGGENVSRSQNLTRVPKRELATTLQVALQAKRLRIAEGLPLADTLLQEFRGFRVKVSVSGHASFGNDVGSWREADHDDLVLATALGVWTLEKPRTTPLRTAAALYR